MENVREMPIGETACRINEIIVDHTGRGTDFYLVKYSIECEHKSIEITNYENNWYMIL